MTDAVTPWARLHLDGATKGLPLGTVTSVNQVASHGWNVLRGDVALPVMVAKEAELDHNIAVMARYCKDRRVLMAPHGKTTMSPQLFRRQLDAGAWAITAATMTQVCAMRNFGVDRIILANQLVEPTSIAWVATELDRDPDFDFYCLVDSVEGIGLLDRLLHEGRFQRRIKVLLELGVARGRSGVRDAESRNRVLDAIRSANTLVLAGIEAYEGLATRTADAEGLGKVAVLLEQVDDVARECFSQHDPAEGSFLVTAGGSLFFDEVVRVLGHWGEEAGAELVLRSGCYVSHDHGRYHRLSPLDGRAGDEDETLRPALEVWGAVLSRPEPDLAIVGVGKRDAPYDEDFPFPLFAVGADGRRTPLGGAEVVRMMDQHAFVTLPISVEVAVGDKVAFGISHPCLAFDKWRFVPVVDGDYTVVDSLLTYF